MILGIVAQKGNDRAAALARTVADALGGPEIDIRFDAATAATIDGPGDETAELADCTLVVSVGGDGTFLYTARNVGTTPVLGVNLGEVGFLNAVSPEDVVDAVRDEVEHIKAHGQPRFRTVPRVVARGDGWALPPGLNEVGVLAPQRGRGHGVDVEVFVDGASFIDDHVDGVLVATPTGSTAYNLAEGGPLVAPGVEALVVTAMNPVERTPPLVVPLDSEIQMHVDDAPNVIVTSDGAARRTVEMPAEVIVGVDPEPGRIAGPSSAFFEALEKLEPTGEAAH